jgi:hypothetical protein
MKEVNRVACRRQRTDEAQRRAWLKEEGLKLARRTRREQGLDPVITDPGALARLAALIVAPPGRRANRLTLGAPRGR